MTCGEGGCLAVCYRDGLHIDALTVNIPDVMDIMFFRVILANRGTVLLCAMYRPQWQRSELLNYLTTNLDDIIPAHNC